MKRYTSLLWLASTLSLLLSAIPVQASGQQEAEFTHAITLKIHGKHYYLAGAADGPNGATDIPGHVWVVTGRKKLIGKHFNTGPFGASQWWSSTKADGELLYTITGIIDKWSMVKAASYYNKGFVHYHELVSVKDGSNHPSKVLWLRHAATSSFDLDSGPHPELAHHVVPGIDYSFIPNWATPYNPAP